VTTHKWTWPDGFARVPVGSWSPLASCKVGFERPLVDTPQLYPTATFKRAGKGNNNPDMLITTVY